MTIDKISEIKRLKFEITNECNLYCEFCHTSSGSPYTNELQFDEIRQVIDVFMGHRLEEVVLTGGEPLCRPSSLKETLKYSSKQGFNTGIYTNGTLISRAYAKELKDCDVKWIRVTVEGSSPVVHDEIRGRGTFQRIIRGIRHLQEFDIEVRLRSTIFKTNYYDFPAIFELARDLHIKSFFVRPFIPMGRGSIFREKYMPSSSQRETAVRSLLRQRQKYDYPQIVFLPSCFEFLYPEHDPRDKLRPCQCGREIIMIDSVGNIKPCGPYPTPLGSIRGDQSVKMNFQNVLNQSDELREIDLPPSEEICAKCDFWDLSCKRRCHCINLASYCPKTSTGSLKNIS